MPRRAADVYRRFAEVEAGGVSATYFEWASGVAGDATILALIEALPEIKRQPNLVFAAARWLGAPVAAYSELRRWLLEHWGEVEATVLQRATQTNEAGRCAVLLPLLSRLDGPVALIEAGASAGLCLYPDRYSYQYDFGEGLTVLDPVDGRSTVLLPCRIDAPSVPERLPEIVWRAGVDLNPLDIRDEASRSWLETLVWPEHDARRERLAAAAAIAAADPPHLIKDDLIAGVPDLVAAAPTGAHIVVFHSAVLVYLEPGKREAFAEVMRSRPDVTWISNEGAGVLPRVAQQLNTPVGGRTVLAVAERPRALVNPHGQSFEAI